MIIRFIWKDGTKGIPLYTASYADRTRLVSIGRLLVHSKEGYPVSYIYATTEGIDWEEIKSE